LRFRPRETISTMAGSPDEASARRGAGRRARAPARRRPHRPGPAAGAAVSGHEATERAERPPTTGAVFRLAFVAKLVEQAGRGFLDHGSPHLAASIAYRVIFSLFPLAIVLTALLGIVLRAAGLQADVVDAIVTNIPLSGDGQDRMRQLLEGATGDLGGLGLIAIVGLVYAATGMMAAIRFALNQAWDVDEKRPFLQGKAIDILLILAASILVLLSVGLSIASGFVERYAADALGAAGVPGGLVLWGFGVLVPVVLSFVSVVFLYRVVPAASPSIREVWVPALAVALVFGLLQNLFAFYLRHFGNYNAVYGSLGAVLAFLFFVYLSSIVFLFGAQAAARWSACLVESTREEPNEGPGTPFGRQVLDFLRGLVVRRRDERPRT
jgi:membrane protein